METWGPLIVQVAGSHSTRVRGLKSTRKSVMFDGDIVALYTSAWIEMHSGL